MKSQAVTMVWSWLRVFLASMGAVLLADIVDGGYSGINWEVASIAGLVSVGPVIFNWLNPNDPRYGRGSEEY